MFTRIERLMFSVLIAAILLALVTLFIEVPESVTAAEEYSIVWEKVDTEPPAYNVEKFSNPPLRSGDDVQTATVINQEEAGTSSVIVPPAESKHVCSTNPDRLTRSKGIVTFNGHRETWYSLPMQGVVRIMRNCGFDETSYPYSVCDNCGCKLLGDFIMLAADTYKIERGTLVETSLGIGIVADHCGRSEKESDLFDIAVNW